MQNKANSWGSQPAGPTGSAVQTKPIRGSPAGVRGLLYKQTQFDGRGLSCETKPILGAWDRSEYRVWELYPDGPFLEEGRSGDRRSRPGTA